MSELRRDPTSGQWVIVASERGLRPHDVGHTRPQRQGLPAYVESCPFCPGNEHLTPPPVFETPAENEAGRWQMRAFPNKFPALTASAWPDAPSEEPLFTAVSGRGAHEVLVETPVHNRFPADRDEGEMAALVQAYHRWYVSHVAQSSAKYVLVFKNQGDEAGTSLVHPHSQIVAAPVVPENVRRRSEVAREYHGRTGSCVYCDIVAAELRLAARIVHHDDHFIVFNPFASARPAETWIVPLEHEPSFGRVSSEWLEPLGSVLLRTLRQLRNAFADPDFNYAIHSLPPDEQEQPYFHWHFQLIPRLTKAAGLELGSGMYVNTMAPEYAASQMRGTKT